MHIPGIRPEHHAPAIRRDHAAVARIAGEIDTRKKRIELRHLSILFWLSAVHGAFVQSAPLRRVILVTAIPE
jgi:hypothetical protein